VPNIMRGEFLNSNPEMSLTHEPALQDTLVGVRLMPLWSRAWLPG
jgi:hypothetical protein